MFKLDKLYVYVHFKLGTYTYLPEFMNNKNSKYMTIDEIINDVIPHEPPKDKSYTMLYDFSELPVILLYFKSSAIKSVNDVKQWVADIINGLKSLLGITITSHTLIKDYDGVYYVIFPEYYVWKSARDYYEEIRSYINYIAGKFTVSKIDPERSSYIIPTKNSLCKLIEGKAEDSIVYYVDNARELPPRLSIQRLFSSASDMVQSKSEKLKEQLMKIQEIEDMCKLFREQLTKKLM